MCFSILVGGKLRQQPKRRNRHKRNIYLYSVSHLYCSAKVDKPAEFFFASVFLATILQGKVYTTKSTRKLGQCFFFQKEKEAWKKVFGGIVTELESVPKDCTFYMLSQQLWLQNLLIL